MRKGSVNVGPGTRHDPFPMLNAPKAYMCESSSQQVYTVTALGPDPESYEILTVVLNSKSDPRI